MKPFAVIAVMFGSLLSITNLVGDDNWPQFRGLGGLGLGSGRPPTVWNTETGENVAWRTAIPGLGHSAPIVWGDRVFLTTAVSANQENPSVKTGWSGGAGESAADSGQWTWQVLCLQLETGKILWTREARIGEPAVKRHLKATHANCTPATDGEFVVAFFGSEGLYCFDLAGQPIWKHDFGRLHSGPYDAPDLEWGFASSPIIHNGRVIVQCDCLNANFVAILDLQTGRELRRIDRGDEVATWSTPLVVPTKERELVVCNGYRQMAGYDLETGARIWHLRNGGDVPVPTPLLADGLIYLTNGHGRSPIYAIRSTATGDLTPASDRKSQEVENNSNKNASPKPPANANANANAKNLHPPGLAWWQPRGGSYMPTPLISQRRLYTCNDNGRLEVRDARDGALLYRHRVGIGSRTYSASAVAAGGYVYFVSEMGDVTVIKEGDTFEEVARNTLDEIVMATPAISGDRLLIRTVGNLFCLAPQ